MTRHAVADIHVNAEDNKNGTGPFVIPKGTTIGVNIQAVHHNPEYWPNPMKFDPQRFLPPKEGQVSRHRYPPAPFTFLPFIAGPRNCLGQHLSLLER